MSAHVMDKKGRWQIRVAKWAMAWAPSPEEVLIQTLNPIKVLRDDRRSRVLLCDSLSGAQTGPWVVKRPVEKDDSFWIRLTTLYRRGEANRMFSSAQDMIVSGIPVPDAIMQFERRRFGMIVESWFVYRYVPGKRCEERHLPQVISVLNMLHHKGLYHGDPHPNNWLQSDDGVVALDMNPRSKKAHGFWRAYDFVLLERHSSKVVGLIDVDSMNWHLAKAYLALIQKWRTIKYNVKITFRSICNNI